jgi:hypothetical protein
MKQVLKRRPPPVPVVSYSLARDDGTVRLPAEGPSAPRIRRKAASA